MAPTSTRLEPDQRLLDFLQAGPPPVFAGFVTADAERLSTLLADAMRRARVRGIIQAGWSGLHAENDDLITVQEVPHAWLSPRPRPSSTTPAPAPRPGCAQESPPSPSRSSWTSTSGPRDIAAALAREDGTRQVLTAIERLAPSGNSIP